jgi:hypothetical protein
MAQLKTRQTAQSVEKFLNGIKDEQQRKDSFTIVRLMKIATKSEPKMWGSSVVGFGNVHLKYASGRELDWFLTGFSPRKQAMTLYLMIGIDRHKDLLKKLGKYKTGKGCLYFKRIEDVNVGVLDKLIKRSVKWAKEK